MLPSQYNTIKFYEISPIKNEGNSLLTKNEVQVGIFKMKARLLLVIGLVFLALGVGMIIGGWGIIPTAYRLNQPVYNPPPETTEINSTRLLTLINQKRNNQGLKPFQENRTLAYVAYLRAKAILDTQEFTHVATISGLTDTRIADSLGYSYKNLRENLAIGGFKTEEQMVEAWEQSEKHAENIFTGEALDAGVYSLGGNFFSKDTVVTVLILGKD